MFKSSTFYEEKFDIIFTNWYSRKSTNRHKDDNTIIFVIYLYIYERSNNGIRTILSTKLFRKHDLNFCPVPGEFNRLNLDTDVQRFFRRIKLRAHFEKQDPNRTLLESELVSHRDKNWTPRINHHSVDTFISCVTKELKLAL